MRTSRIPLEYYGWLVLAVPLTFLVHEFAHWLAGEWLGYTMHMTLNGASAADGQFRSVSDEALVSAAGPLITFVQGLIAFWMVRSRAWIQAYAFLFVAWFMRFAAAAVSVVHPNDEARISQILGAGTWTVPVIVVVALLALAGSASRRMKVGWKVNLASFLICGVAVAVVVLLDAR